MALDGIPTSITVRDNDPHSTVRALDTWPCRLLLCMAGHLIECKAILIELKPEYKQAPSSPPSPHPTSSGSYLSVCYFHHLSSNKGHVRVMSTFLQPTYFKAHQTSGLAGKLGCEQCSILNVQCVAGLARLAGIDRALASRV